MSTTASQPSRRRFSLAHLVLIVPWIALVIDAWAPIRDNSFLWHVRAGELQRSATEVLTADPFSFTVPGEPWLTQSWLAELAYSWGERVSGLGFVPPMMLTLTTITFIGIGLIAFRSSGSLPATALILILSTILLIRFLVPRPVIFSFALFVLVILAWERPQTRWALPLLFWIWASVHGSFVIGLAFVGLALLMKKDWRALPTAIMSGLVTLITAHGIGVIGMLTAFVDSRETLALLTEWRKPELFSLVFFPFVIGVVIIVIGAFRGYITPTHLWLIVPFTLLGLSATRAVPPAWIALVPLTGLAMKGHTVGGKERFSRGPTVVFGVVILILPFLLKSDGSLDTEHFPVAAARARADVPTFHDDRTGGYLIWLDGPDRPVYIDDRAELYQERIVEFSAVRNGDRAWEPVFARDGIEQVLLRADESLLDDLRDAGWVSVYQDEEYVVLQQ